MKIITKTTLFATLIFLCSSVYAQNKSDFKATEVLNSAIEAMGGKDFLENIKTLYSDVETTMDGRNVHWVTKEMAPNRGSFEIVYQGRVVYRSFFDGVTGYEVIKGEKKVADQEGFKDKPSRKYIINELEYSDTSLYKTEYIGEENANGKLCDKIKATSKIGKVVYLYYDKNSHLLAKSEVVKNAEKDSFSTKLYDDYKKFGDLVDASKITLVSENGDQIVYCKEIIYNKGISKKDFE